MTRTEAREALDALGIEYPMSGSGSGLASLLELLPSEAVIVKTDELEIVGDQLVVKRTLEDELREDHGFDFYKTGNGYGWTVHVDGVPTEKRWRSRHSGDTQRREQARALHEAKALIQ